jgi:hypothetical protein
MTDATLSAHNPARPHVDLSIRLAALQLRHLRAPPSMPLRAPPPTPLRAPLSTPHCAPRPRCKPLRPLVLATALGLIPAGGAVAFPLIDLTNQDQVPQGTELAAPDAQDLRHQLQMVNGLAAPAGGGWTFVPRIDYQEMLTDNVQQQHAPRQADLVTYFAPGFNLAGDLPRLQMTLSYAPVLSIYARTSSLNSLTQQLYGLGTVTLVPELAYVDVRAISGVQSIYGGLGGLGTLGATSGAGATAQAAVPTIGGNAQGLTKDNEVQTTSFGISPYLLHNFGEWGSAKLGYSLDVTRSHRLSGFVSPPFPTGGAGGQTLVTNEVAAHYGTGEILSYLRNSIDFNAQHGQTTTDAVGAAQPGGTAVPASRSTSSRVIITDTVSYAATPGLVVFASAGHEDITFSNQGAQPISSVTLLTGANGGQLPPVFNFSNTGAPPVHDLTWSLGATWTPNPDGALTLSYGHQNGFNAFSADGHYLATARTLLTVSYASTLGTQLQNLQNQLNLAANNGSGTLVNGQTGGPLFAGANALAVQNGVFRTDTLTVGSSTTLDRDIMSIYLLFTTQTGSGANTSSASSKGINASWLHEMRPDMTFSAALAYSIQDQATGFVNTLNPGSSTSLAASLAWQYQISETLGASLRYSLLERQSASSVFSFYQNMLILGISKTF